MDLHFLSVSELSDLIAKKEISPVEVIEALLERIDRYDSVLHSYITVRREEALTAARRAERDIRAGRRRGPLHGIPISHKDISWTKGVRTTAHSKTLLNFVPDHDATHVRRLARAGMILLGKTNTTEFALGGLEVFGIARNPWNLAYYTGGSSAGSANALAAGLAVAATGSDTGGSIRVPASFCGIVGLKPTYGRISRYGVIPLSWTLDHAGPMTRGVRDCALMLNAMAGYDPLDPSSARLPVPNFAVDLGKDLGGLVLGVPQEHYYERLEPDVDAAMRAALRQLETLGVRLEPVSLPHAGDVEHAYQVVMAAEAFGHHAARLRAQAPEYSARGRRRIAAGAFYTAGEYQQALRIRARWIQELDQVVQRVDGLVAPTLPYPAFTVEAQMTNAPDSSWGTRQFNMSGLPALSVPCGFTSAGLPIGMQLVTGAFDEVTLFRIADAYEQSTDWHRRRPPLEQEEASRDESRSRVAAGRSGASGAGVDG